VADFASGKLNAEKKNVVVIGGGDTAMDCVRTAIARQPNPSPASTAATAPTCRARNVKSPTPRKKA